MNQLNEFDDMTEKTRRILNYAIETWTEWNKDFKTVIDTDGKLTWAQHLRDCISVRTEEIPDYNSIVVNRQKIASDICFAVTGYYGDH